MGLFRTMAVVTKVQMVQNGQLQAADLLTAIRTDSGQTSHVIRYWRAEPEGRRTSYARYTYWKMVTYRNESTVPLRNLFYTVYQHLQQI
jgi:hypothetical protein